MALNRRNFGRLGRGVPQTARPFSVPASVGGVNSLDSYAAMPPEDCIYTYNLMPVEYGLQLRQGWRRYATGADGEVRTIIAYESNSADTANDRLWSVTENGIYNTTTDGETSPTQEVAFSVQGDNAGFGTWLEFTNDAGNHYLFYADYENGLHQYEESTGTWSVPVSGTGTGEWSYDLGAGLVGFPVDEVAYIMVHKLRIWVILRNSSDAWYLPIASIAGELKKFTFGAKMKYGGTLQGLWSWTLDGGDGVDDYLVGVGRGGDVIVYRGGDPEGADFALNGNWFVGATPNSRRIAAQYGSEMYVLSTFGITSMRDLLQGSAADNLRTSASAKVNRILRTALDQAINSPYWSIFLHPADGFMQVIAPSTDGGASVIQYNQNLNTKAWGFWEGVPIACGETFNGRYYMGALDYEANSGELWLYSGVLDDRDLSGDGGRAISFRTLTSFQSYGNMAHFKNVGMIRVVGLLSKKTNVTLTAVYDFDVEATLSNAGSSNVGGDVLWDSAVWDGSNWTFNIEALNFIRGTYGIGRSVAIGMRGSSQSRIDVVSWDLMVAEGGFL